MRSDRGGHAKDKVQTMISTDVMISSTICRKSPTTGHPPPATSLTPPGAWRVQLSKSLDRAHRSIHGSILSSEIGSVLPLERVFGSVEPSRLGVTASAIGSVLESVLGSSVSNGSGPSLRVRVQVGTAQEPDRRSGSSINPNCQFGYGSIDISLPV